MKKWKPMFWKFLWGHGPDFSPWGRWRVTSNFGGITIKISKCFFHHELSWSIYFHIYIHIRNRMRRNQDNVICRFWATAKLEVEWSQSVGPKISKWVFSHAFPLDHKTQNIWWNRIQMNIIHFIDFWRSTICEWSRKVKSHKKIAWKWEVMKTLWKLDCEFWVVFYFISTSHVIRGWASA